METKKLKHWLVRSQSIIALVIMCVVLSLLSDKFLTGENAWNVMRQISVNVIISVGMTLVILTGGIDLSVGSILALAGAVTAGMLQFGAEFTDMNLFVGFTLLGALVGGTVVGGFLGWFNGFTITRFKVPPFVATLAMLTIARGLTMLLTGGFPITGLGPDMAYIGTGWFLGIPMPVWISAVIVALAVLLTKKTRLGRHIYAIGGNETAARLSGVKIARVKMTVYALAGALAGIGGIIVTSRLDSSRPAQRRCRVRTGLHRRSGHRRHLLSGGRAPSWAPSRGPSSSAS
ncbi:MAG: hypothetical protein R2751_19540 [Bacteroidales bacterium]